jgi:predicted TIM-barrel fold metal-dependent hydrolase
MELKYFDADEHYYEPQDCFTRFASKRMQEQRFVRWVMEGDGKRQRLVMGGREINTIGNPTFDPIARPGVLLENLKSVDVGKDRGAAAYGKTEPIRPAYRDRNVRLQTMDAQGVERTLMFPTLGVVVEGFIEDAEMLYACIHAFNEWLDDDWGFAYQDRIFAVPYLSMMDLDRAIAELDWVLKRGARAITIRPGPAYGRSPADPYFDPFWARVNEAEILVTYHAYDGPSLIGNAFRQQWAAAPQPWRMEDNILMTVLAHNTMSIVDTLTALVLHNLFGRFPKIRVATIELGASWVPFLLQRIDFAGGFVQRKIPAFGQVLTDRPSSIFREKVWVAPYPEEDIPAFTKFFGAEHVLMGSDWPHAEATPEPGDYMRALKGLDDKTVTRIVHDNAFDLVCG